MQSVKDRDFDRIGLNTLVIPLKKVELIFISLYNRIYYRFVTKVAKGVCCPWKHNTSKSISHI